MINVKNLRCIIFVVLFLIQVSAMDAMSTTNDNELNSGKPAEAIQQEPDAGIINLGNELFKKGKYNEALKKYIEAEVKTPGNSVINYNIGNSLYKTGKLENALKKYQEASKIRESLYNSGNTLFRLNQLQPALQAFKTYLIENPKDKEAKFNYELIKKMLDDQKNRQQDKKDDQDKQKNQDKQDENKKDQQDQEKKKQDDKNKQQDKKDSKQQKQQKKQIDPEQVASMLRELKQKEKELLKKLKKEQVGHAKVPAKDW